MATVLSVFDISMPVDEKGDPIPPALEFGIATVRSVEIDHMRRIVTHAIF